MPPDDRKGLARRVADAVAAVLALPPQSTWVKLRFIEADDYAENSGGPPVDAHPVFVYILQAQPPQGAALAELAGKLTEAVARACRRPAENVHLIYEPAAAGRIVFGGQPPK